MWGVLFVALSLPVFAITATDFEGRIVSINARPQRIVSLASIATRVIAHLELLDRVVGLDQNSLAMDLPPKPLSTRELSITNLGNAKTVNEEALLRLRPDLIITQYDKVQADRLSGRIGVPVLCIQNRNGMDYELYELLGKALFAESRAAEINAYMKGVVSRAERITRNLADMNPPRVYVATDVSLLNTFPQDPIVTICGGKNAAAEITTMNYWGGATVDAEFLLRSKPDIIIVWISFTAPHKVEELRRTIARREYANIPAIKNKRVYISLAGDGKDYFYTMVSISETLYHFYPEQYTMQMLEQDVKAHLLLFYPAVAYAEYQRLRGALNIN
jgi:iron complex transport system substrate-binding protein